jgi:hypothetical protein
MKSLLLITAISTTLTAGFISAANANEAPEFRNAASTQTRAAVQASAIGAAMVTEASIVPVAKSVLTRSEVAAQALTLVKAGSKSWNELAASQLN